MYHTFHFRHSQPLKNAFHADTTAEFYDQENGELSWPRVVSHIRSRSFPSEVRQRRQVLALGGHALALVDAKIVVHGFEQCTFFWLSVCRLTRRG